jgi:hypothetical protein
MTESVRQATRLEFYLPAGRHFTLIKRGSWFGLARDVAPLKRSSSK